MFKKRLQDLAIFGGPPAFVEPLHVGSPNLYGRQKLFQRIDDLLDRKWLTNNGIYVQQFEKLVADLLGVKHCIATCNGTVALEIAIRALDLIGEVIIPAFTFIATAHALQWLGIRPVFCDIDPLTHNIDPQRVEESITERTTGLLAVHLWGRPCAIEQLSQIAERHKLKLLFDAAHAFGCSYKGRMIGNFGEAEIFSFHATKFVHADEGGAVVTNNDDLATKIRLMRNFGFAGYDQVISIGTNGKMSEISAAIGISSLENIEQIGAGNFKNYTDYQRHLINIPSVRLICYNPAEHCNYQHIVLEIDESTAGISRDQLIQLLHAENILARRYFSPGCHRMEPYRSYAPYQETSLPETNRLADRVLCLPTGSNITSEDIEMICHILRLAVANSCEIRKYYLC
jgi:dTDP-4-amino-4,6-dideoxygalactose transaminase